MAEILVHDSPVIVTGPFFPYGGMVGLPDTPGPVLHARLRVLVSEIAGNAALLAAIPFARIRLVDITIIAVGADVSGGQVRVYGTQNGAPVVLFAAGAGDLQQSRVNLARQLAGADDGACFALCDRNTGLWLGTNAVLVGDAVDVGLSFVAELAVPPESLAETLAG